MAESAFNFGSAPGGKGRQFGGIGALAKAVSGKRSGQGSGLSARDQSHLSSQSHAQNKDMATHVAGLQQQNATMSAVVGHVVGQESSAQTHAQGLAASKQTHKQGMAASKLSHKHGLEKSEQENTHKTDTHINMVNSMSRLSDNSSIKGANISTGALTTTHPQQKGQQFDGDTASTSSESVPLNDNKKE